jgi:hypothetical protein
MREWQFATGWPLLQRVETFWRTDPDRVQRRDRSAPPFLSVDVKTLSAPQAGRRYYGLGKNASYEAAKRGEIPTIRIGARLRVPVIAMERILQGVAIPESATPVRKAAP